MNYAQLILDSWHRQPVVLRTAPVSSCDKTVGMVRRGDHTKTIFRSFTYIVQYYSLDVWFRKAVIYCNYFTLYHLFCINVQLHSRQDHFQPQQDSWRNTPTYSPVKERCATASRCSIKRVKGLILRLRHSSNESSLKINLTPSAFPKSVRSGATSRPKGK